VFRKRKIEKPSVTT